MNNIIIGIKKFFQNKNIVTVLGIIIILVLLYWGYTSTINAQIAPTNVPVATRTIQPREEITSDMVTTRSVPRRWITENVIRNSADIIGKHAAVNSVIPAGSMFFRDVVIEREQLPDSAFIQVQEGHRPYALAVTTQSTYGNSIFPGNVIDVFMRATTENGQVMVGRLLSQVKVLAVKDNAGNNVFENTAQNRVPATLLFGVPNDVFLLLRTTEFLRNFGVELFPVPHGGAAPIPENPGDRLVDRQELVNFIEAHAIILELTESDIRQPQPDTPNQQQGW